MRPASIGVFPAFPPANPASVRRATHSCAARRQAPSTPVRSRPEDLWRRNTLAYAPRGGQPARVGRETLFRLDALVGKSNTGPRETAPEMNAIPIPATRPAASHHDPEKSLGRPLRRPATPILWRSVKLTAAKPVNQKGFSWFHGYARLRPGRGDGRWPAAPTLVCLHHRDAAACRLQAPPPSIKLATNSAIVQAHGKTTKWTSDLRQPSSIGRGAVQQMGSPIFPT